MKHCFNIVVISGLVSVMLAGSALAASRNPWALYQQGGPYGSVPTQPVQPAPAPPRPAWQVPAQPVLPQPAWQVPQPVPQQPAWQAPYGNEYAPLPGEQRQNTRAWPGYQRPYAPPPYGYPYGGGYRGYSGYGGQFGFGMNLSPGFGFSGMPFGFSGMPFSGGGLPYGGGSPWGFGLPMF